MFGRWQGGIFEDHSSEPGYSRAPTNCSISTTGGAGNGEVGTSQPYRHLRFPHSYIHHDLQPGMWRCAKNRHKNPTWEWLSSELQLLFPPPLNRMLSVQIFNFFFLETLSKAGSLAWTPAGLPFPYAGLQKEAFIVSGIRLIYPQT